MPVLRRLIVVFAILGAASGLGALTVEPHAYQTPQAGRGLIFGRVIEAGSGRPVRGALVEISRREEDSPATSVLTDSDGQFVFSRVPAGKFMLRASRSGYSRGSLGQRRPGDEPGDALTLTENERKGDVALRLWKHGAITGSITNELGEPLINVEVRAFRRVFLAGRPRLGSSMHSGRTDDRGVYRVSQLAAGDYVLVVPLSTRAIPAAVADRLAELQRSGSREDRMAFMEMLAGANVYTSPPGTPDSIRIGNSVVGLSHPAIAPSGDRLLVYPSQYFAGAGTVASARTISLQSGQEVAGIDLTLKPVRAFVVSGRLVDDRGPVSELPIRLLPGAGTDFEMDMLSPGSATVTDAEGRFTLMAVTPGEHTLRALKGPGGEVGYGFAMIRSTTEGGTVISTGSFETPPPSPSKPKPPTRFATAAVTVGDADVTGLSLTVRNGVRLSGRIEFAGGDPPTADAVRRLHPIVEARDGLVAGFEFEMVGDVSMIADVTADRRFETVELPPGSYYLRVPNLPSGWTLDSVMLGGRDISDVPVDVTDKPVSSIVIRFTDKPSTLAGTVQAPNRDDRLDEAIVVAFPVDRAGWIDFGSTPRRLKSATVSRDGAYSMVGLPAGEYFVVAFRDDMLSDWRNPAFLDAASRSAVRVAMGAGEQKSQALTLRPVR